MDKQKEKKEIATILSLHTPTTCKNDEVAEALIKAGYGNVARAVEKFAERLKTEFWKVYPDEQMFIGDLHNKIDELVKEVCGE